jgi:hypothetical protein
MFTTLVVGGKKFRRGGHERLLNGKGYSLFIFLLPAGLHKVINIFYQSADKS